MDGDWIRELRARLELSQERFAHLLGVSLQTVRRWESGLSRPLPFIVPRLEELHRRVSGMGGGAGRAGKGGDGMGEGERGSGVDGGLGGLFKGLGNLLDLASRLAEEGEREESRSGEFSSRGGRVRGVYGFSVRTGAGGRPRIDPFGDVSSTPSGPGVSEAREPLVDLLDEGERVVVIVEMPGVEERDVRVEVGDWTLTVDAGARERRYHKRMELPAEVERESLSYTCRNGVLEVHLAKRARAAG